MNPPQPPMLVLLSRGELVLSRGELVLSRVPLVDSRPRLRARLRRRVDHPQLPILVLLSRGELVLSDRWGEPRLGPCW